MGKKVSSIAASILPYSLLLFSFSIPVSYRLTIYSLAGFIFCWLLSAKWRNLSRIWDSRYLPVVLPGFLWFMYLISLLYSRNITFAAIDLMQKLSLLLFPLMLLSIREEVVHWYARYRNAFLFGLTFTGFYLLVRALSRSLLLTPDGYIFYPKPIETPWENYFFYTRFTHPFHPTYLSMYYSLGIVFLAEIVRKIGTVRQRLPYYMLAIFFIALIYFCSSKAGLIMGFSVVIYTILWVLQRKSKVYAGLVLGVLLLLGGTVALRNERVGQFISYFSKKERWTMDRDTLFAQKLRNEGTVRIRIWGTIPGIMQDRWIWGVGTGDTKEELVKGYGKYGLNYAGKQRLNAHNQYLQTLLATGLIGLSILLLHLVWIFWLSLRKRNVVLALFITIVAANLVFEAMFERVFGVMFYAFFITMLAIRMLSTPKRI